jgi:hypothetical protein
MSLTEGGDEKHVLFFMSKKNEKLVWAFSSYEQSTCTYLIVLVREVEENTSIKISFWPRTVGIT